MLGGRYRIVGLLGRGGMGEVYRADDIKLGSPVALKFLPRRLADDPVRREQLFSEVRTARQVAHPNVCRVFDIGEADPDGGRHFLSMEYIDGEDLASLLLRIGRLPPDKALDIARQICAGLAAAHERGVLHRDLKPANIMLDGRGRVRITDFGLAVAASAARADDISGTPLYMSPQQLAGKSASVSSDIYALGLVLYELYTGKRAFSASSLAELIARKESEVPPAPSELIRDIDPAVDRAILRAIARDPASRPASVAKLAAALPGGSALEAVLRAGETPSPDMVAASGTNEGLEAPVAWVLLSIIAISAVAAAALGSTGLLWRNNVPERSPEVLAGNARQMLAAFGYGARPADWASGLEVDLDQLRHVQTQYPTGWRSLKPEPRFVRFWYRESPQPLEAWRFPYQYGNVSRITPIDPPLDTAGMALVRLDPSGRLTQLLVVPSSATAGTPVLQPDWTAFLTQAGFDSSAWQASQPERNPPVFSDARAAWTGSWPASPDLPVRLEAASLGGKPVYFEAIYPWTPLPRQPAMLLTATERAGVLILFAVIGATLVASAVFAQRNLRAGRGDRRGAFRLSMFVFVTMLVSWLFGESHVATLWEVALVVMALSWASLAAAFCWFAYLAVEPFLRRHWPAVLVTWARLVAGDLRDPLVGRDVLIGCAAGTVLAIVGILGFIVPERLGMRSDLVFADVYGVVYRVQGVLPLLVWRAAQAVLAGLGAVFLLLWLRIALRSQRAAVVTFVAANAVIAGVVAPSFWIPFVTTLIHVGVFVWLIVRLGLLAAVLQFYVWGLFIFFPLTADLSAWYAGAGVSAALVLATLTLYSFRTALGGRSALGKTALE